MSIETIDVGQALAGLGDLPAKQQKQLARKQELAESAIEALKKYGYARTSLRDIAKETGQSLGVLHYYFESKEALLIHCVRLYKGNFIATVRAVTESVPHPIDRARALCVELARAIAEDAATHRLWYDIRGQAMFDPVFAPVVQEVEEEMVATMAPFTDNVRAMARLYARLDGAFRWLLQQRLSGSVASQDEIADFLFEAGFGPDGRPET